MILTSRRVEVDIIVQRQRGACGDVYITRRQVSNCVSSKDAGRGTRRILLILEPDKDGTKVVTFRGLLIETLSLSLDIRGINYCQATNTC